MNEYKRSHETMIQHRIEYFYLCGNKKCEYYGIQREKVEEIK